MSNLVKPNREPDYIYYDGGIRYNITYYFWFEEMVHTNSSESVVYKLFVEDNKIKWFHQESGIRGSYSDLQPTVDTAYQDWLAGKLLEEALEL